MMCVYDASIQIAKFIFCQYEMRAILSNLMLTKDTHCMVAHEIHFYSHVFQDSWG